MSNSLRPRAARLAGRPLSALLLLACISWSHAAPLPELGGIRAVQPQSDQVVTVWLGYLSADDPAVLTDPAHYRLRSATDPRYEEGVRPYQIDRFSRAGRSANASADWRVLMDHFIHLRFEEPFQPDHRYFVEIDPAVLPRDMPRTGHFRLDATANPSFKLNQLGYTNVTEVKHIYLSSYLGDGKPLDLSGFKSFRIVDAASGEVVFRGPIEFVAEEDRQAGDTLYRLDISGLSRPGWFYAEVPGLGRSYTFRNGPEVAEELYGVITNGLYLQRAGTALVPPWGGDWVRPISHHKLYIPQENVVHPWDIEVDPEDPSAGVYYDPEGPRPIRGGHHDAGDYDTRLTHLAVPEKLMTLYEGRPERFFDGQSFIPEAGNGVPDILDEAAWSLLHYELLQDYFAEAHGGFGAVPSGMESWKHPPVVPVTGDGDPLPYWMRKATPYSSFSAAAVFAQAARVFEPWDQKMAEDFLARARAAYAWALSNRDVPWEPENPQVMPLNWEDDYDAGNLAAAQTWAAAQLYVTTEEATFWSDFLTYAEEATTTTQGHKWSAVFPVFFHEHPQSDHPAVARWRKAFLEAAQADLALIAENARQGYETLARNEGDWGKANPIANVEIPAKAWLLTREQAYRDAVAVSVDFTLGMNPTEMSWMTGVGTVHVMDPLSANSKYDGVLAPQPGIVIFGPSENYGHDQNPLYPDPAEMGFYRRMGDSWGYVPALEYVVDEQQANMTLAAGVLLD